MKDRNKWNLIDITRIKNKIKKTKGKVVLGIDGIIDEVWQVLETRNSLNDYQLFDEMKDFGKEIVNRQKGGMANEIIRKRRCSGGFTANTGRAVSRLSSETIMLGMYGKNKIDSVFNEFKDRCQLISIGHPAVCHILEFKDGKVMLPYLENLLHLKFKDILKELGTEKLKNIISKTDVLAVGYWSNMPAFDEIINSLVENYFTKDYPKRLFFDFANLSKRTKDNLQESLNLLGSLDEKISSSLSLNKHEASILFDLYGFNFSNEVDKLLENTEIVRNEINLDEIIIHTTEYALSVCKSEDKSIVKQDYCPEPVKTAGAGDTFNAGYLAAYLYDLDINERLAIGNATTAYYVNNGIPPTKDNLLSKLSSIKRKFME